MNPFWTPGISGIAAVLSAVITVFLKNYLENKKFKTINKERQEALSGRWNGKVYQNAPNGKQDVFNLELNFDVSKKKIDAVGKLSYKNEISNISLSGAFRTDSYVLLEYQNENKKINQFGSIVFRLSDDCTALTGRYVGYGHKAQSLVFGEIKFTKENS